MESTLAAEILVPFSPSDAAELRRTPEDRDGRLRRTFRLHWCGFALLLAASIGVLAWLGPGFALNHPFLLVVSICVAAGRHARSLVDQIGGKALRFHAAPAEVRGAVEPAEVDALAAKVATLLGSRGRPNFYIAVDKQANAFAANSMLFNFVPRYNAIFVNSYLCKALSRDEMRAILVHELAHFHRYMSPLTRNAWLGVVGSVAASVAFFSLFPWLTDGLFALLALWWGPLSFMFAFNLIAATGGRELEYACDSVAAEVVGAESMVNALLKLGDRAEIFELVEHEMARHLDENPKASAAEIARELIDRIPDDPVALDEARSALSAKPLPAAKGGSKKQTKQVLELVSRNRKLRKALHVVRWSRFDTICRDGWLDRDELHVFVRSLARKEHAATHEVAIDHPTQEPAQTHPSTRKRTIHLYLQFLLPDDPTPGSDCLVSRD